MKIIIFIIVLVSGCTEIKYKEVQPNKDIPKEINYTQPETLFVKANDTLTINIEGYRELFIEDLTRGGYLHLYLLHDASGKLKYPIETTGTIMITKVYY